MTSRPVMFVTGGSRGLGEATVLAAASSGYDVAFTYLSAAGAAEAVVARVAEQVPECRCACYALDVRDAQQVEEVGDRVLDDFDTVHVVVNNAAINRNGLAISMSDEDWHEVIATNLTGAFYVARQFLPALLAQNFGRLIFLSSIARSGLSGQANYAASKAGLLGLSSTLAKEYGRKGITSNVVVPGYFDTDMTRDTMAQDHRDFWVKFCPLGRMGQPDEVTGTILYLASDGARFVNGQCIEVTGGLGWSP